MSRAHSHFGVLLRNFYFFGLWVSHGRCPTAGGVGVVGAGHGLWGASDDYSMPTFAPELAKHDPFRRPRAMVVVWVALHVPVQVLPHDLPTEAHGDPPSRTSVTCQ